MKAAPYIPILSLVLLSLLQTACTPEAPGYLSEIKNSLRQKQYEKSKKILCQCASDSYGYRVDQEAGKIDQSDSVLFKSCTLRLELMYDRDSSTCFYFAWVANGKEYVGNGNHTLTYNSVCFKDSLKAGLIGFGHSFYFDADSMKINVR